MMIFPIGELLDEQRCYDFLLEVLHPEGLHCPNGHLLPPDQTPHDRHRDPLFDYRCRVCGKVCNIFPPRRIPRTSEAQWRVLRDAERMDYVPGLRVNYRDYGLDPETREAIMELTR